MGNSSQSWEPRAHRTQPVGSSAGWRVSYPNGSVGLCLFQASRLVFVSSGHLDGLGVFFAACFVFWGERDLGNLVRSYFDLFTFCLKELPYSMELFFL